MSLINQVLLELEKRRASGAERATLPDHVRALPESGEDHRALWFGAAGAAVLALAGVAWLALAGFASPRHAAAPAPAAAETGTVIERVVAASAVTVTDVTPQEAAAEGYMDRSRPAARLSFELSGAPAAGQLEAAQPAADRPRGPIPAARVLSRAEDIREGSTVGARESTPDPAAAVAPRAEKQRPKPSVATAAEQPASKQAIEKQVRQPTARELSDNEYRKAAVYLHQGRLAEAQEGFRAALKLYPGHHGARQALVALLVEGKQRAEAEAVLLEGIKLAPEQIGFAMTLARLQLDRGDSAGAMGTLQVSLPHAQESPDYIAFFAALLQRQGRHEEAIAQFLAALRAKPGAGVWWLGLAMSLQAVNRAPEAQDAYRHAKNSNSLNPELTAFADQRLRQLQ